MDDTERLERILAVLLLNSMGDASQQEKITQLNLAGFSNVEIAEFLQTTPAVVAQTLYAARKGGPKGASRTRKKRKS